MLYVVPAYSVSAPSATIGSPPWCPRHDHTEPTAACIASLRSARSGRPRRPTERSHPLRWSAGSRPPRALGEFGPDDLPAHARREPGSRRTGTDMRRGARQPKAAQGSPRRMDQAATAWPRLLVPNQPFGVIHRTSARTTCSTGVRSSTSTGPMGRAPLTSLPFCQAQARRIALRRYASFRGAMTGDEGPCPAAAQQTATEAVAGFFTERTCQPPVPGLPPCARSSAADSCMRWTWTPSRSV